MGHIIIIPVPALVDQASVDPVYVQSSAVAGFELATSYYNIRGASSNHCTTTKHNLKKIVDEGHSVEQC